MKGTVIKHPTGTLMLYTFVPVGKMSEQMQRHSTWLKFHACEFDDAGRDVPAVGVWQMDQEAAGYSVVTIEVTEV